ncbi:hypothetical protein HPB51_021440 [Rhipicephalus microplus]|uniref:Uncharacterized protein n=1 Tax=Rhipicephalus microplus TaxID=6941 RepID=A0A9J6DXB8_RHIMP|nr:hypothetical protein HPB51_021440 [Rhipicephalus microplus]
MESQTGTVIPSSPTNASEHQFHATNEKTEFLSRLHRVVELRLRSEYDNLEYFIQAIEILFICNDVVLVPVNHEFIRKIEDIVGINLTMYTEQHKQSRGATDQLNVFIFLTALLALNGEALLNNVLLMYRAPQVLELLRMFSFIERLIGAPQYVQCESVKFARKLVASQAARTFLNVLMNIYSDFGTAVFVQDSHELAPVNMVIAVSNAFTGVPFLTVNCVSTRLLLMYVSRLIGLYVRCILKNVDQCLRSWSTTDSSKVIQMVQTRYQISLLKSCSNLASSFLGPSMLYGYSYCVVLLCTAAYYTIIPDLQFRARLFFLTVGILHWLSILLPVCEVNRMKSTRGQETSAPDAWDKHDIFVGLLRCPSRNLAEFRTEATAVEKTLEQRARHKNRDVNVASVDTVSAVFGNGIDVLQQLIRSVVREELQKLNGHSSTVSSLAEVVREEVRQAVRE